MELFLKGRRREGRRRWGGGGGKGRGGGGGREGRGGGGGLLVGMVTSEVHLGSFQWISGAYNSMKLVYMLG